MIKMTIDREVGVGYLYLTTIGKGEAVEQVYLSEKGMVLDFNKAGQLLGIEFLNTARLPSELLKEIEVEIK